MKRATKRQFDINYAQLEDQFKQRITERVC